MVLLNENQSALKKVTDLLKTPLVLENFFAMMGCSQKFGMSLPTKNTISSVLDKMVGEQDRAADQKIQKLRYLLRENPLLRKKAVNFVAKKCLAINPEYALKNLEKDLGVLNSEEQTCRLGANYSCLHMMVTSENRTLLKR